MGMSVVREDSMTDATRLRQRGLRVTAPRLAILSMLEEIGGHRAVDELVLALHQAGYHHARTTVYNALDDLARAGLVRAAPVDAGALRYESAGPPHHHFVCRGCGVITNVAIAEDLEEREPPRLEAGRVEEIDVVYRGLCAQCASAGREPGDRHNGRTQHDPGGDDDEDHHGQLIDLRGSRPGQSGRDTDAEDAARHKALT